MDFVMEVVIGLLDCWLQPLIALCLKTRVKSGTTVLPHSLQFLTQEEFEKMRLKQLASSIAPRRGKKRQLDELLQEQEERRQEGGELLSEAAIEMVAHGKRKHDKQDRMSTILVRGSGWGLS